VIPSLPAAGDEIQDKTNLSLPQNPQPEQPA